MVTDEELKEKDKKLTIDLMAVESDAYAMMGKEINNWKLESEFEKILFQAIVNERVREIMKQHRES